MPESVTALLVLWNDIDPELEAEYNRWHAHEHVPERCTVPGIMWGRRYRQRLPAGSPRYLTLYGLSNPDVMDSEPYQRLLQEPTSTSRRMRPALRNVSRWLCWLRDFSETEEGNHLTLWTAMQQSNDALAERSKWLDSHGISLHFSAERIPDARPLPWMTEGQRLRMEGSWLMAADVGGIDAQLQAQAQFGAIHYERLGA